MLSGKRSRFWFVGSRRLMPPLPKTYMNLSSHHKYSKGKTKKIEQIEKRRGFSVCNNMNRSTANEFASPKSAKILSDLNHHKPKF